MSAAEEDTELRDLLINTLESNGVLSKIKAELRASVFLALEEQERADSKPSLINQSLRQFVNTREGRLVLSLVTDFLQHFHLDFTLAVLQPEACLPAAPEDRVHTARELGLPGSEASKGGPLLLELLRRFLHKEPQLNGGEPVRLVPHELPPEHIAQVRVKFALYDRDNNGAISKDELRQLFTDLVPHFHANMLDTYVNDEFTVAGKDFNNGIGFQEFLAMYKRLFRQCRSVVAQDVFALIHAPHRVLDGKSRSDSHSEKSSSSSRSLSEHLAPAPELNLLPLGHTDSPEEPNFDDEDVNEGDSFFDDPIPKPEKRYGWKEEPSTPKGAHSVHSNSEEEVKSELGSLSGAPRITEADRDIQSNQLQDLKTATDKMTSLELGGGNEDDYMDDFNSTSQRSDKSEVSIGEDLEELFSVDDLTGSDNKLEDLTLDNSISHMSDVADYLEDVS